MSSAKRKRSPDDDEEKATIGEDRDITSRQYWLLKTDAQSCIVNGVDLKFTVADLEAKPLQTCSWDGVRNTRARNFIRDKITKGDLAFMYHSSCKVPSIVAITQVVREAYADPTAFDKSSPFFDPDSDRKKPKWFAFDLKLVRRLDTPVTLASLRERSQDPEIREMFLFRTSRLSVQPVTEVEWNYVLNLESSMKVE